MPWKQDTVLRWNRHDGATVMWDQRSPYPNPARATARMWTAWEPEPSQRYLARKVGKRGRFIAPRRFKTAEAAMRAVDRAFPPHAGSNGQDDPRHKETP